MEAFTRPHPALEPAGGGDVYKYVPGANSLVDLGQVITGETDIWDLEPGLNGEIYGGTSPYSFAFKCNGSTFSKVTNSSIQTGETYVRAVAFDPTNNILYFGIGSHAYLIRYDISSGVKTNILPSEYSGEEMVTDLDLINGVLFARLTPSKKLIVLSNPQGSPVKDAEIPTANSRNVSPLKPVTGVKTQLIRTPNGDKDARVIRLLTAMGYQVIQWSVDSLDWMNPGIPIIQHRVTSLARPGSIILMHASDSCKQTVKALPAIIDHLQAGGYRFMTVSQLLGRGT